MKNNNNTAQFERMHHKQIDLRESFANVQNKRISCLEYFQLHLILRLFLELIKIPNSK